MKTNKNEVESSNLQQAMANIEKIIIDIIEDNTMKLQTPTGKSNTEYYQTKIDVCNQILEKVRRENAESEQSNCTIPDVSNSCCNHLKGSSRGIINGIEHWQCMKCKGWVAI